MNVSHMGKVAQVIGAVVDVEFPDGTLPEIYNAIEKKIYNVVTDSDKLKDLVLKQRKTLKFAKAKSRFCIPRQKFLAQNQAPKLRYQTPLEY